MKVSNKYYEALEVAWSLLDSGLEPTSALREGGAQCGIPYGKQMKTFVEWGLTQI